MGAQGSERSPVILNVGNELANEIHEVWFDEANVPVALRSGNTPIGVRRNMDINHALFVAKGVAEPVAGYI